MNSKTPVAFLQEICAKKCPILPEYTLIGRGGTPHDPVFYYQVSCLNRTARGEGTSKQEAKHNAAKALLSTLEFGVDCYELENPYEEQNKENTVGELQEFCLTSMIHIPRYERFECSGSSFTCQCIVPPYTTTGEGRTKQLAKHHAAYLMLLQINEKLPEIKAHNSTQETETIEKQTKAIERLSHCLEKDLSFNKPKIHKKIVIDDNFNKMLNGEKFMKCKKFRDLISEEFVDGLIDPLGYFEEVMAEISLEWTVGDVNMQPESVGRMIALQIREMQNATFIGRADSFPEAKLRAIVSALKWFATMKTVPDKELD